jgi:hypothetical protein
MFLWNGKGTSYPPKKDKVYDHETVSRTKEVVGWGYPQRAIFCIQIARQKDWN